MGSLSLKWGKVYFVLSDNVQTMSDNRFWRSQGVSDTKDNEIVIWDSEAFVFELHYECKTCFLSVYLMGNNCILAFVAYVTSETELNSIGVMREQA